jgi:hypothetical protein
VKFNTSNKYLTNSEDKKLKAFWGVEPQPKIIYTNAKGEKRRLVFMQRPIGCIAPDTVYGPPDPDTGHRPYHTPCATAEGAEAQIYYEDMLTGEKKTVGSNAWVRWAGASLTMESYVKPSENLELAQYVEVLRNVAKQPPRKMTDEDREAKWVSLKDGKPV